MKFSKIFKFLKGFSVEESLVDLISKILVIEPEERLDSFQIIENKYFDEIRDKNMESKLVGIKIQNLFNFSQRN